MWYADELDSLFKKTATTLKEAVTIQQQVYILWRLDACNIRENYSERCKQLLARRAHSYRVAIDLCEDFLDDKTDINDLMRRISDLEVGKSIYHQLYKLLPLHLREMFKCIDISCVGDRLSY